MTERPRYASLRDYLGLLRRQRWLILATTLAFAAAALATAYFRLVALRTEAVPEPAPVPPV